MSSDSHFDHAVGLARDAIKALLLFNAGAAGALVALTDKAGNSHDYTLSILFFGCGAMSTIVIYIIGYLSQLSYANHCLEVEKGNGGAKELSRHERLQSLGFKFLAVAVFFSVIGIGTAFIMARS